MRHTLYSQEDISRLTRKKKICLYTVAAVAVVCVGAVATLLARTDAYNEKITRYTAEAAAVLLGWAVLALLAGAKGCRQYLKHTQAMLSGPQTDHAGTLGTPEKEQRIPGGTDYRRVMLDTGHGAKALCVHPKKAALLPPAGTRVRIVSVFGFITAWEAEA